MSQTRIFVTLAAPAAAGASLASEYRGAIQAGGLPVPGATVAATRDGARTVTATDERGEFRFADLADGVWTIEVEMVGFEPLWQEVGVAASAPEPKWKLKFAAESVAAATAPSARASFQRLNVNQSGERLRRRWRAPSRPRRWPA